MSSSEVPRRDIAASRQRDPSDEFVEWYARDEYDEASVPLLCRVRHRWSVFPSSITLGHLFYTCLRCGATKDL